jgi:hypothetical protein
VVLVSKDVAGWRPELSAVPGFQSSYCRRTREKGRAQCWQAGVSVNIGLKESLCFRMCINLQCKWECFLFVELYVNGRGRGHMLWDLFCGCVRARALARLWRLWGFVR